MRKADTTAPRSNAGHGRRKFCKGDFLNMYASWLVDCPGEESFSVKGRSQKLSEICVAALAMSRNKWNAREPLATASRNYTTCAVKGRCHSFCACETKSPCPRI